MLAFHTSNLSGLSRCTRVQLGPDQFVLGSVMVVQRGHDEVQMIADNCRSLCVTSIDVANKTGSVVQLGAEDSVDDCHVECVDGHSG